MDGDLFNSTSPGCELGVSEEYRGIIILGVCLIMFVSLTGNAIVILVLGMVTNLKNDLNNYLLNLAVADLLISVLCMPAKTFYIASEDWVFGYVTCNAFIAIQHTILMVSALTLTMIGLDRYKAVKSPLQSRRNGSQSKSNIFLIWMVSMAFSVIPLVRSRAREARFCGREVTVCGDDFSRAHSMIETSYQLLLLVCECVIPLSILAYTYTVVCLKLWVRRLPGNADQNRDLTVIRNKKKTIKMLVSIVVLFAVCLLPMQLYNCIGMTSPRFSVAENRQLLFTVYFTCHWLGMVHSGINPIIYGFMNENFRVDAMKLLRCSFPCVRSLKRRSRRRRGFPLRSTINGTSTSLMTTTVRSKDALENAYNMSSQMRGDHS